MSRSGLCWPTSSPHASHHGLAIDSNGKWANGRDAIASIAQNPVTLREYTIVTLEKSMYATPDAGKSWKQIANQGRRL